MTKFTEKSWRDIPPKIGIPAVFLLVIAFFICFSLWRGAGAEQNDFLLAKGEEKSFQQEQPGQPTQDPQGSGNSSGDEPSATEKKQIAVDMAGAVNQPGVIMLEEGSRIFSAVKLAGGLTAEADTRSLNLAAMLTDGEKLYIPTKQETQEFQGYQASENGSVPPSSSDQSGHGQGTSAVSDSAQKKINLNTADEVQLQELKGVGPSTAGRILDYRREYGDFQTIEDLKNVKGIGEKTFEKLKNSVCIR